MIHLALCKQNMGGSFLKKGNLIQNCTHLTFKPCTIRQLILGLDKDTALKQEVIPKALRVSSFRKEKTVRI